MCGVQDSLKQISPRRLQLLNNIKKESSSDVRKEKSRDAARYRRAKESDYFQELSELLPVHGTPPNSQMTSIDKTSLIRLSVAYLKTRDFIQQCVPNLSIKEEVGMETDVEEAVHGFSLVLNQEQDIVHVSNNVNNFIGLTSFELVGMPFSDFVHPCDHLVIRDLLPHLNVGEDHYVKAYLRVKCTITDRGRLINLKQASYKSVRVEGRARRLKEKEEGGLAGLMFLGVCSLVSADMALDSGRGVFETKHSTDFQFVETDGWLTDTAGYDGDKLQERSLLELVHAQDTATIQAAFNRLVDHGHCETGVWRLLVAGGGHVYVQTRAAFISPRKGSSRGNIFHCKHSILTEILEAGCVESLIQLDCRREYGSAAAADTAKKTANRTKKVDNKTPEDKLGEPLPSADNINDILQMLNQDAEELKQQQQFTVINKRIEGITELKGNDVEIEDKLAVLEKSTKHFSQDSNESYDDLLLLSDDEMDDRCSLRIDHADIQRSRSSVIVRPTPCAVTTSLFTFPEQEKKNESVLSDPFSSSDNLIYNSAGSPIYSGNGSPGYSGNGSPVSGNFGSDNGSTACSDNGNSGSSPQLQFPSGITEVPINSMFGNFLSSELEKLSPFIGNETIPLSKQDYQGFEALGRDYLDDLEFPDTVLNFNANTESVFSQDFGFAEGKDPHFVRSSTDFMWESPQDGSTCGGSMDDAQKFPNMVLMVPVVDGSGLHDLQNAGPTPPGPGPVCSAQDKRIISQERDYVFQPIKRNQNQKGPNGLVSTVPLTTPVDHSSKDTVFQILEDPPCEVLMDPGDILNNDLGAIKIIPLESPLRPPGSKVVEGRGIQGNKIAEGQGLQGNKIAEGQGLQGNKIVQGNAVFQDPGVQGNDVVHGPGVHQILLESYAEDTPRAKVPLVASVGTNSPMRPIQDFKGSTLPPPVDLHTRSSLQQADVGLQRARSLQWATNDLQRQTNLQRSFVDLQRPQGDQRQMPAENMLVVRDPRVRTEDQGQQSVIKYPPGFSHVSSMSGKVATSRGGEGYIIAPSWEKGCSVSVPANAGTYDNKNSERESVLMNLLIGSGGDYISRNPPSKGQKRVIESDAKPGGRPSVDFAAGYRQSAAAGYHQPSGDYRQPAVAYGQYAAAGYNRPMTGGGYKMAVDYRQPAIKRRSVDYSHLGSKAPRIGQPEAIKLYQRASLENQQAFISKIDERNERRSTDQQWSGVKSPIAVDSGLVIPVSPECAAMLDFGDSYATAASEFQTVFEEV